MEIERKREEIRILEEEAERIRSQERRKKIQVVREDLQKLEEEEKKANEPAN